MLNTTSRKLYRLIITGSSCLFVVYFALTLIFSLQKSNLYGGFWGLKAKFQVLFYQKWGFFKDREDYNYRLYYVIRNKSTESSTASIEVLQSIRKHKTENAPLNQKEIITDNILKRSMAELLAVQLIILRNIDTTTAGRHSEVITASQIAEGSAQCRETLQTLENYATVVAAANNIDTAGHQFKVIISKKYFNEFKNRDMPAPENEQTVFEGSYKAFK